MMNAPDLFPLFVVISGNTPDWESHLERLILNREPIQYREGELPDLPERLEKLLVQQKYARYLDASLETVLGAHYFLIPM